MLVMVVMDMYHYPGKEPLIQMIILPQLVGQ
jgi:hypothetical protein